MVSPPRRYRRHTEHSRHIGKSSAHIPPSGNPHWAIPRCLIKTKPIEHLEEDFPAVAAYLRSISIPDQGQPRDDQQNVHEQPSQHTQNAASEYLTSELISAVQGIMERSEREGTDPDEELRAVVGRTVIGGVATGFDLSEAANDTRREDDGHDGTKRPRTDDGPDKSL